MNTTETSIAISTGTISHMRIAVADRRWGLRERGELLEYLDCQRRCRTHHDTASRRSVRGSPSPWVRRVNMAYIDAKRVRVSARRSRSCQERAAGKQAGSSGFSLLTAQAGRGHRSTSFGSEHYPVSAGYALRQEESASCPPGQQ